MKLRDLFCLILLGAIWGAAFMFTRMCAAPFGPATLVLLRVGIAAVSLLPLLFIRGQFREMLKYPRVLIISGLLNAAIPFSMFAYASLSLTAGFTSLLNATTPLMAAVIGALWYGQRLKASQWVGLMLSIIGVSILCWGRLSFKPGGSGWSILAVFLATFCYGAAAHYIKRNMAGVPPLVIAAGSMTTATLALMPLGITQWPSAHLDNSMWIAILALGFFCTAIAFLLYFYLVEAIGATQAASVTFLVPVFAIIWSIIFLHESLTMQMIIASAVILLGTALVNGLLTFDRFKNISSASS